MIDPEEAGPSSEVVFEQVSRKAAALSPADLDEEIAVAIARRDVAAAHGRATSADLWATMAAVLDDVRRARLQTSREIDAMTSLVRVIDRSDADPE